MQRVDGWFEKSKNPSLTLLDVAISGTARAEVLVAQRVGGLFEEVEESLAHASGFLWFSKHLYSWAGTKRQKTRQQRASTGISSGSQHRPETTPTRALRDLVVVKKNPR
ncbi:MAG: hypothetical protein R3B96_17865 [Pirellulaceae bacterium]